MREQSVVCVKQSAGLWYVTAGGHDGLYWHDSQDGAVEEAILWACLMRPARVVLMDGGRKSTIAEYGVAGQAAPSAAVQFAPASAAAI